MPIFEYRCASCDEKFEEIVLSRNRTSKVECPRCGGKKVKPLISVFAAQTGRSSGESGECFSRSAGICEAGGGPMT